MAGRPSRSIHLWKLILSKLVLKQVAIFFTILFATARSVNRMYWNPPWGERCPWPRGSEHCQCHGGTFYGLVNDSDLFCNPWKLGFPLGCAAAPVAVLNWLWKLGSNRSFFVNHQLGLFQLGLHIGPRELLGHHESSDELLHSAKTMELNMGIHSAGNPLAPILDTVQEHELVSIDPRLPKKCNQMTTTPTSIKLQSKVHKCLIRSPSFSQGRSAALTRGSCLASSWNPRLPSGTQHLHLGHENSLIGSVILQISPQLFAGLVWVGSVSQKILDNSRRDLPWSSRSS